VYQNVLAQTLVGLNSFEDRVPNHVFSINPENCAYHIIAKFPKVTTPLYYYFWNSGWVDQNGVYYANFLNTHSDFGTGVTYTIDLNEPQKNWTSWGNYSFTGFTMSPAGDVYGIGINPHGGSVAQLVTPTWPGVTFSYPGDMVGFFTGGVTFNTSYELWGLFFNGGPTYDFYISMDLPSGFVNLQMEAYQQYPIPINIFYDEQNDDFFAMCQISEWNLQLCKVFPGTLEKIPEVYGTNITVKTDSAIVGAVYSSTNRIMYIQLYLPGADLQAHLMGYDVDTGLQVSSCLIPLIKVGGQILNLAVWNPTK